MKMRQVVLTIGMVLLFSFSAQAADKIGFVDLSRLFDEYHKTKAYDKVLEERQKKFQDERNGKLEKVREAQGKIALLKDDKKADLEKDIETMKNDLMEFDRQEKTSLTQDRNEKIREILLEIEKIVSDYAEKNGYALILNDRVLIYGAHTYDLTEEILKLLNVASGEQQTK